MTNAENIGAPAARAVQKRASGSSFYIAMRLMPAEERDAMFAIYAFCRKVDDIADDGIGTRAERHERLEGWRRDLRALYEGTVAGQVRFLAPAVKHYGLRLDDFLAVLDGMDMDVAEDIVAPDLATLDLYCDRVASAVGRLSIKVFGMEEGPGFDLAHHLGRALQLTNILRDVDEDAAIGRLYLPREYLEEMDCCRQMDPAAIVAKPEIDMVCRKVAALAHRHYDAANRILAARPKGRIKTPRLMGAVYSEILRLSEAQGFAPPRHRASLPKSKLLSLVLRQGLFS
ncbi:MAG TPA: presqualene diphosphate synthase HpnD [Rhizomicrobium sp.]|jgi:phytoene synthase|nr:presqualene diphosphate synthase HpnD [Rhizomicrobium sp.]